MDQLHAITPRPPPGRHKFGLPRKPRHDTTGWSLRAVPPACSPPSPAHVCRQLTGPAANSGCAACARGETRAVSQRYYWSMVGRVRVADEKVPQPTARPPHDTRALITDWARAAPSQEPSRARPGRHVPAIRSTSEKSCIADAARDRQERCSWAARASPSRMQ